MFESGAKRKFEDFRNVAALHGIKMKGEPKDSPNNTQNIDCSDGFMFGDPADYEEMDAEERDSLTRDMLQKHKVWNQTGYVE